MMEGTGGSNIEHGGGSTIKIKVYHGSNQHDVTIPSQSTFGDLKRVIAQTTGLDPELQNLLFRGKDKEDTEQLHMAGLKDNAKVIVMEAEGSAVKEANLEEVKETIEPSRGCEAVAEVREENDNLAEQVAALETVVCSGIKVADKDIVFLTEMLMRQLLKLDGIDAQGEGKVQRKIEPFVYSLLGCLYKACEKSLPSPLCESLGTHQHQVHRIQSLVDTMDSLKERNSNPDSDTNNSTSVTVETESDVGSANALPSVPSSTKVTQEWEVFD